MKISQIRMIIDHDTKNTPVKQTNAKKLLSVFVIFLLLVSACSTSRKMESKSRSKGDKISQNNESAFAENSSKNEEAEQQERIIIYDAYMQLVVENPDTANRSLEEISEKYEGYVQVLGTEKSIIRVQSKHLQKAVKDITQLGKVKSKRISGDDVTAEYKDYKIRLENAKKARKRYLELLEKAEDVEATLKMEKELERLNGKIDRLNGKIYRLEHLSNYSTITVYLKEKKKPGILGYIGIGLYYSIKWLFVRN